jgi:hypothetical protein
MEESKMANFLIKGKMLVPNSADETLAFENEIWEFKTNGRTYRLVPAIEVEDDNINMTYYLNDKKSLEAFGFDMCSLDEANWMEE